VLLSDWLKHSNQNEKKRVTARETGVTRRVTADFGRVTADFLVLIMLNPNHGEPKIRLENQNYHLRIAGPVNDRDDQSHGFANKTL